MYFFENSFLKLIPLMKLWGIFVDFQIFQLLKDIFQSDKSLIYCYVLWLSKQSSEKYLSEKLWKVSIVEWDRLGVARMWLRELRFLKFRVAP